MAAVGMGSWWVSASISCGQQQALYPKLPLFLKLDVCGPLRTSNQNQCLSVDSLRECPRLVVAQASWMNQWSPDLQAQLIRGFTCFASSKFCLFSRPSETAWSISHSQNMRLKIGLMHPRSCLDRPINNVDQTSDDYWSC